MSADRLPPEREPNILGAVVHGPAMIAESVGIAIAVRCIFAKPDGLEIDLALRAIGVQAEAAVRQTFGTSPRGQSGDQATSMWHGGSEPVLLVEVDGRRVLADPQGSTSSGGDEVFASDLQVAVAELPLDGSITFTASWPEAGLAEGSVTLALETFDDLENKIIRLPS